MRMRSVSVHPYGSHVTRTLDLPSPAELFLDLAKLHVIVSQGASSEKAVEFVTLQGTERYAMAAQILLPPILDLLSGRLTRSLPEIPLCVVLPQRFCEKLLHALVLAIEIE